MSSSAKGTVNVVTSFPNPWKPVRKEIVAIDNKAWAPSIDDFAAVAGNSTTVKGFYQFLGVLLLRPKGKVDRVNIFTHSNPKLIAFKGTITPRSTYADVRLDVSTALSLQMLEKMTPSVWFQVGRSKKKHYVSDIRERFAKGAKVFFYSCKSATDPQLLQEFADTFQVTAVGFKKKICFPVRHDGRRIHRGEIAIGSTCRKRTRKFTKLDGEGVERKPNPK
jgi:hypothetical protein